ncbi:MAG TPA: hypothetical protein VGB37_14340 [Candidatus Lokiarchaeia archaeon]
MTFADILEIIVYGVIIIFAIFGVCYFLYWVMKKVGIISSLNFLFIKIPDEIYEECAVFIANNKSCGEFAQYISKFSGEIQKKYLKAYFQLKKLNQVK